MGIRDGIAGLGDGWLRVWFGGGFGRTSGYWMWWTGLGDG